MSRQEGGCQLVGKAKLQVNKVARWEGGMEAKYNIRNILWTEWLTGALVGVGSLWLGVEKLKSHGQIMRLNGNQYRQ